MSFLYSNTDGVIFINFASRYAMKSYGVCEITVSVLAVQSTLRNLQTSKNLQIIHNVNNEILS